MPEIDILLGMSDRELLVQLGKLVDRAELEEARRVDEYASAVLEEGFVLSSAQRSAAEDLFENLAARAPCLP